MGQDLAMSKYQQKCAGSHVDAHIHTMIAAIHQDVH